jgi:2-methylcitrate dehydratase
MKAGFDHTVTQAISLAAGVARVLGLSQEQTAHAIAISSVGGTGLAATRAGRHLSNWKGLASADMTMHVVHSVLLAKEGVTGPLHVFEGPLGWKQLLGAQFPTSWNGRYDGVLKCNLKRFNAEFHSQSCLEGLLEMRSHPKFDVDAIRSVQIEIFKVAYEMIGGGKYLDPKSVLNKEDADHSLHYLAAVCLLDGQVEPEQFEISRIESKDVRALLKKVRVGPSRAYTRDYPDSMRCRIKLKLGRWGSLTCEKKDFEGFYRRPMPRASVLEKFRRLGRKTASEQQLSRIADCVFTLETRASRDLVAALTLNSSDRARLEG